jgi:hypothetical protein
MAMTTSDHKKAVSAWHDYYMNQVKRKAGPAAEPSQLLGAGVCITPGEEKLTPVAGVHKKTPDGSSDTHMKAAVVEITSPAGTAVEQAKSEYANNKAGSKKSIATIPVTKSRKRAAPRSSSASSASSANRNKKLTTGKRDIFSKRAKI